MHLESQKSEGKSHKEGKGRKKGKKKHKRGKGSESEEEVEQMHAVSTVLDAPDVRFFFPLVCVCICLRLLPESIVRRKIKSPVSAIVHDTPKNYLCISHNCMFVNCNQMT